MKRRLGIAFDILILALGMNIQPSYSYDGMFGSPPDMFGGPEEGEEAPEFQLKTLDGQPAHLSDYLEKGPVVLEFGSYTCPIFRQRHPAMERLRAQYSDQVSFLTIYTLEAHPKGDVCPYIGREWVTDSNEEEGILYRQPLQESEREELAKKAQADVGLHTLVALDDMENSTWKAYGGAPNSAYLIGRDGRVRLRQGWFEPEGLEQALTQEVAS